jgi:ribosome-associated protein
MAREEDPFEEVEKLPRDERPSRSSRKRAALAAQKLGEALLQLKPAELDALGLPEELRAALAEARRLTSRAALARQRQYIGRLMRDVDPEPLERALAARPGTRLPRAKMPR